MFEDFSWISAAWLVFPPALLELWIRFGPKGRRTETTAGLLALLGFVETSGLADIIPENQWKVVLIALGYGFWRLRRVTTTAPGQK